MNFLFRSLNRQIFYLRASRISLKMSSTGSSSTSSTESSRHYANPYDDYSSTKHNSIVDKDKNIIQDTFKEELTSNIKVLMQMLERNEKHWSFDDYSIYTGVTGIAYLFYHYGKYFHEDAYIMRAAKLIRGSLEKAKGKRHVTFLTGIAGPLALGAVINHLHFDREESKNLIERLRSMSKYVLEDDSDLPDELLYGRSGYLFTILYVNSHISPAPFDGDFIRKVIASIIKSGRKYSAATRCESPIMYSWYDKEYLGGAHGLAGILYILLQAREYLTQSQLSDVIQPALRYLIKLKYPSGNFPSSVGSQSDKLVHWCHGAPSMTMLFCLAYKVFQDKKYLDTAVQCGEVIWLRGLLKKGYGLCHGVSGNAYTFLYLFQETKDTKHLYRACKFAEWCMDYGTHQNRIPDRPFSLFEGLAGTIYFLIDLGEPMLAKFPGYTLNRLDMSNSTIKIFLSKRVVFPDNVEPAGLIVRDEKIYKIVRGLGRHEIQALLEEYPDALVEDFASSVLMPGVIDSHVHVNEPGRTDWEGFRTATKAAAVGGVTTIVDMPLNSIPPTTTLQNLRVKANKAEGKVYVDVGFWGGVIPGNDKDLRELVNAGVVGFKCFLCPSGVDEFPHVDLPDVEKALKELKATNSVLAFHAETELTKPVDVSNGDSMLYETFLRSRPAEMEVNAIKAVSTLCKLYKVRCHIVHLSASDALPLIKDAKNNGAPLTVETCHHYLNLSAEQVPKNATEYKCCPPIREKSNQDKLWRGLQDGTLDMVVSDHSPCTAELKRCGDFLAAWGGISSLQFGLPLMWTGAKEKGLTLQDVSRLLTRVPAELCSLNKRKGSLEEGMDADFVVWDPEKIIKIKESEILHKNKLTPYEGKELYGRVVATILRGNYIYKHDKLSDKPIGNLLLRNEHR
ncbi:uncharacterized protein LOC107271495 [Cephus cinctus]|uniref:allantoinase n=1 Tax=Cephus cinctus TaxID=211228 RepID=A0AAJ7FQB7_CEPCN|nr:uncharacterized protein LOC107271495 [Cephus cinctus]